MEKIANGVPTMVEVIKHSATMARVTEDLAAIVRGAVKIEVKEVPDNRNMLLKEVKAPIVTSLTHIVD